jgi:hypothetical protein
VKPLHSLFFALLALLCGQVSAREAAWPGELDTPYSADNPPGPSFTDAQKQAQRVAGMKLLSDLRAAFAADADWFTVPPGDYRFGTAWKAADSFVLENFDREPILTLHIDGQEVARRARRKIQINPPDLFRLRNVRARGDLTSCEHQSR